MQTCDDPSRSLSRSDQISLLDNEAANRIYLLLQVCSGNRGYEHTGISEEVWWLLRLMFQTYCNGLCIQPSDGILQYADAVCREALPLYQYSPSMCPLTHLGNISFSND